MSGDRLRVNLTNEFVSIEFSFFNTKQKAIT